MEGDSVFCPNVYAFRYPLHWAANSGFLDVATILIANGANPDALDLMLTPALHEASMQGHDTVTAYLLQCGADVNARDDLGFSALHRAASNGHTKVCIALVEAGAEINCMELEKNDTPLDCCIKNQNYNCIQYLKKAGALTSQGLQVHSARQIQRFWRSKRLEKSRKHKKRGHSGRETEEKVKALERDKMELISILEHERRKLHNLKIEDSAQSHRPNSVERRRSSSESALLVAPSKSSYMQSTDLLIEEDFPGSGSSVIEMERQHSSQRRTHSRKTSASKRNGQVEGHQSGSSTPLNRRENTRSSSKKNTPLVSTSDVLVYEAAFEERKSRQNSLRKEDASFSRSREISNASLPLDELMEPIRKGSRSREPSRERQKNHRDDGSVQLDESHDFTKQSRKGSRSREPSKLKESTVVHPREASGDSLLVENLDQEVKTSIKSSRHHEGGRRSSRRPSMISNGTQHLVQ